MQLPDVIGTEEELDELLTRPRAPLVDFMRTLSSPFVILGAGGKMGPTLSVLAKRAAEAGGRNLDVISVSRFSDQKTREWLEQRHVRTVSCDLLDSHSSQSLPPAEN